MEDDKLMKLTEGKLELDDFSIPEHKEIFQLLHTISSSSGGGSTLQGEPSLRSETSGSKTGRAPTRTGGARSGKPVKFSPSALLDKTENERTKQILSRISAMDLGTAELSIQLADYLKTLNNFKKDKKIKTLKETIKKALQNGETEKADLLTKEFERLKKA